MDELKDWIRERSILLIAGSLAVLVGIWWWQGHPQIQPPGVLAPLEPVQTEPESRATWASHGHRITPLACFEIRARILGRERYRLDRAAELSPVDFALGWGPMSDTAILEGYSIQQRDRWYFWSSRTMPIPAEQVTSHSANMHMIPANGMVAERLLAMKVGQVVELHGQLVRADGKDGWTWVSSLSRTDTGDGSCEVFWVEAATADR
jgi:hypothetical protein